jgi:hypothetical protein
MISDFPLEEGKRDDVNQNKKIERDPEKDSVETYKDLTKLIISLATGTLVLATTLLGLLKIGRIVGLWSLCTSSIFLVLSVACGILVLSSLAGSQHANDYNIDYLGTRLFAIPQWITFILGLVFFMCFVFKNLRRPVVDAPQFGIILDTLVEKNLISTDEKASLLSKVEKL